MGSMITQSQYYILFNIYSSVFYVSQLLLVVLIAFSRRRFYLKGIKYYPQLFALLEIIPIVLFVFIISSIPVIFVQDQEMKDALSPYVYPSLGCILSLMGFLLLTILTVYLRPRLKSYLFIVGIPIVCYLVYFGREQYAQIAIYTNEELISPYTAAMNTSLSVPEIWVVLSKFTLLLIPLLLSFLIVKNMRHDGRFLLVALLSVFLTQRLMTDPFHLISAYLFSVYFLFLLVCLLFYAPIFRQNLKSVFRFSSFSRAQKTKWLSALAFLFGINLCFVWYLELHHQYAEWSKRTVKSWHYPAEVNLVDALGTEYGRYEEIPEFEEDLCDKVNTLQWNSNVTTFEGLFLHQDFPGVEHDLIEYNDQLDHFLEMVQRSDYFSNYSVWWGSLRRIRDMSRIICFRARCSMFRGDVDSVCDDMEALYRFVEISNKGENIVLFHGHALRGMVNDLVSEYLAVFRNNPDNLWKLKKSLDESREGVCYLGPFDLSTYTKKST